MKDIFSFNKNNIMRVSGEKISGFLLDINALQSDGTTVCDISDLNKIQIEISVRRGARNKQFLFNGKLDELLTGLYANTLKYANCIKKLDSGYKVLIDFGGVLDIPLTDELTISSRPEQSAFSSLALTPSSIECETVPAVGQPTAMPLVESIAVGNNETSINEPLGNNVVSIVIVNDFTASYDASSKAKIQDVTLTALGLEKNVSNNLLIAENMDLLRMNPATDVKQIVVYRAKRQDQLLNQVRLKANLTKGADQDARILVLKTKRV